MKPLSKVLSALVMASVLSACATTGSKSTSVSPMKMTASKEALARSQSYMDGVDYLPAASGQSVGSCQLVTASESWKTKLNRANACVDQKNWKVLRGVAETLANSDVDSPWGAYFLSLAADESGDLARALWMADLAQKKVGGQVGLFAYQKARVLLKMKEVNPAIAEMQKALSLEPRLVEGHLFLAEIYTRDLDMERATKYYQSALAIDPKNTRALNGLAWVKQGAQDMDKRQPAQSSVEQAKPVLVSEKASVDETGRKK